MNVVNLAVNTPMNDVLNLVADTLAHKDFKFKFDLLGDLEGLYLFDTPTSATYIEMNDFLFFDIYDFVMQSEGISTETKARLDFIAYNLDEAA